MNEKLRRAARVAASLRKREHGRFAGGSRPLGERLWARVNMNGPVPRHHPGLGPCWVWCGATNEKGYGKIDNRRAHRVSWSLEYGGLDARDLVLHSCDNPACVRPSHLFLGSAKDNTDDMFAKGRNRHKGGFAAPRVTDEQMTAIRRAKAAGQPLLRFVKEYGLSSSTVYRIANSLGAEWWRSDSAGYRQRRSA
jgi:hypothetical protein